MLSIAMINPLVMLVVVTTLYQKRGGHCFFIFKSGVILGNTRFLIKNGVSDLTLPNYKKGRKYEKRNIFFGILISFGVLVFFGVQNRGL